MYKFMEMPDEAKVTHLEMREDECLDQHRRLVSNMHMVIRTITGRQTA